MPAASSLRPASRLLRAWHVDAERVHHNNPECLYGGTVPLGERRAGAGGRPLCDVCVRLNAIDEQLDGQVIPFRF